MGIVCDHRAVTSLHPMYCERSFSNDSSPGLEAILMGAERSHLSINRGRSDSKFPYNSNHSCSVPLERFLSTKKTRCLTIFILWTIVFVFRFSEFFISATNISLLYYFNTVMHRVRWRHSNLWSHYDLYDVGQHSILFEVQRWRFVALFE